MAYYWIIFIFLLRVMETKEEIVRVTTIADEPYLTVRYVGGRQIFDGYMKDLMDEISAFGNFSYEFQHVRDGSYGALYMKNNSAIWNGMIGELHRKEADITAASLTITSQRSRVVDFSHPFSVIGLAVLMKKTTMFPNNVIHPIGRMFAFILPFDAYVWLSMVISTLIVAAIAYGFKRYEDSDKDQEERENFGITMLKTVKISFLQGTEKPKTWGRQILMFAWITFSFITMMVFFSTMIKMNTIHSSVSTLKPEFSDTLDLIRRKSIKIGTISGGSTYNFFMTQKTSRAGDYNLKRLAEKMFDDQQFVRSTREGMRKVAEGNYAFVMEDAMADYVAKMDPCNMIVMDIGLSGVRGYGFAFPIGSKYKSIINQALEQIKEQGYMNALYEKWFVSGKCSVDKGTYVFESDIYQERTMSDLKYARYSVSFLPFGGLYIFLVVMIVISALVFAGEYVLCKGRNGRTY